jgi:hypothetical protein
LSKEVKNMEKKEKEELEESEEEKKKKVKEKLPQCTTAPSAEHSRAHDDDEPCDDGRTGDTN